MYWDVANTLLVGFVQTPERYPLFSQTLVPQLDGLVDSAVLMQAGSPGRLLQGVPPVISSTVLYLAAAFGIHRLMRPGRTVRVDSIVLFFGYALSPLGHAGFYFTDMAAKVLLSAVPDDYPPLLALSRHSYRMLAAHWMTSAGPTAAGWLLLLIQTLRRRALLPRVVAWCNPSPAGAVIAVSCSPFPQLPVTTALGEATFNLAQLVSFVCATACVHRRGTGMQPGRNRMMPPLPGGNLRLGADACNTGNPSFRPKPITHHFVVSNRLKQFFVFRQSPLSKPLGKKAC